MNAASSCSSAAGSRARRRAGALLALALAGCGPQPPPTAQTLALAAGDFRGIVRIETLSYVADAAPAAGEPGLLSAGRYAYHLGPPHGGVLKVTVLLFSDAAATQAHWQRMHRPEALAATTPLDAGDAGWIYRDDMAATRVGRAIYEIRARGAAGQLEDFARACARKAARELGR